MNGKLGVLLTLTRWTTEEDEMKRLFQLTFFIVLFVLFSNIARAQCPIGAPKSIVFFGNGIDTSKKKAVDSRIELEKQTRLLLAPPRISDCVDFGIAYNTNELGWLDLLQGYVQAISSDTSGFWRCMARLEIMPAILQRLFSNIAVTLDKITYISDSDLRIQAEQYRHEIQDNRKKVILVSHSQGNFYANETYNLLSSLIQISPNNLELVSVANPDNFVGGNMPHTTLFGDVILIVPGRLDPNTNINGTPCSNNGQLPGTNSFGCHDFISSYLTGTISKPKILEQIISAIPIFTPPLTGIRQITNTSPGNFPGQPVGISQDGSGIVFLTGNVNSPQGGQLWSVNTDGSNLIPITPDSLNVVHANFGGTKIAFVACDNPCGWSNLGHPGNVYVVNTDGTGLTKITTDGGGPPISYETVRISSDGRKVVYYKEISFVGFFNQALFIDNTDGTNEQQLALPPNSALLGPGFALNSDGSKLEFVYTSQGTSRIAFLNTDGTGFQDIVNYIGGSLALSGDGSTIAYFAPEGVAVIKTDGTGQRILDTIPLASPNISYDGTRVCYTGLVDFQHTDIFCIRSDATDRRNVSNTPAGSGQFAQQPALSENGAVVAFISNADLDPGKNTDLGLEIFVAVLN